ncbi:MAG: DUF488 domain-containing protein [Methanomassiliicoccales archaeon]
MYLSVKRCFHLMLRIKRVYEPPSEDDGYRILVDRLWPRGLTKEKARLDEWMKDIAPSDELRKWFAHEEDKWGEFKKRYFGELKDKRQEVDNIKDRAKRGTVTLLYSTSSPLNNAVALKEFIEKIK